MTSNPTEIVSDLKSVPEWLNETFVEKHLRNHYDNNEIRIIDFVVRSASGDLGNFGSKIYRINVTFKVPPKDQSKLTSNVSQFSFSNDFLTY